MKEKIRRAVVSITEEKRRNGEALPYATSIEVALLLGMNALEVESMAQGIEGIVKGRTLNGEWYDLQRNLQRR